ncbi:hypothetical protein BTVI_159261 [Pitangus sulphuratus]|nr:hypothetical protein BTVI_159261 [Pitangus sulphuratus]
MASEDKQVVQPTGDDGGGGGGAGKEGNAAEGGSVLQPLNPGVPIRGIKMKFAVLTGLVEVGEVSNRDIVDTVFNLGVLDFIFCMKLPMLTANESNQVVSKALLNTGFLYMQTSLVGAPLATVILVQSLLSTHSVDDKVVFCAASVRQCWAGWTVGLTQQCREHSNVVAIWTGSGKAFAD